MLEHFYGVSSGDTSYYFFPFAVGNLIGPLLLGKLFDTVGRRRMISSTYVLSGVLLLVSAYLFHAGALNATTQTVCGACLLHRLGRCSSAYLTVSEIFPLELRGQAISYFFAIAQGIGGSLAPSIFGHLIGGAHNTHPDRGPLTWGYVGSGVVMIAGGVVALPGVNAERQSLEDVARPLSARSDSGSPPTSTPRSRPVRPATA